MNEMTYCLVSYVWAKPTPHAKSQKFVYGNYVYDFGSLQKFRLTKDTIIAIRKKLMLTLKIQTNQLTILNIIPMED